MRLHRSFTPHAQAALGFVLLCLLALGGCATTDTHASAPPPGAATTADPSASGDYPMWTRVTSWLLTPFTGATGHVGF